MIMTENDYDQLFRQLSKLQVLAPCHNGICVGCQQCEYGINDYYGEECAIQIIRKEAERKYNELMNRGF